MESIIFIGVQATGKSTFYLDRFYRTHIRINLDMLKTRNRENRLLDLCLDIEQPFVVDNTNPTEEDRKRYILPAKNRGFKLIGYYFQSHIMDSIERNEGRPDVEKVPIKGIKNTHARLQLPTYAEGFDQLYYVAISENRGFVVKEWTNEI